MSTCDKHASNPAKGYSPCAGCEVERLQRQNEELKQSVSLLTKQRNVLAKSVKQALMITSEYEDNDATIGDALNKMDRWSIRVMGKSPEWDALVASQEVKS